MSNPLEVIMNPRSIAFFGGNNDYMKMGSTQLLNIIVAGYKGKVIPIHPTLDSVQGLKAYPSISDIPPEIDIDLAFIVLPARHVPKVVEECGERGIKHGVIVSAGFRETGNLSLREELLAACRKHGFRFLGPNCFGFFNNHVRIDDSGEECAINTTWLGAYNPVRGGVSIASQSGTFMSHVFLPALDLRMGFSKTISLGNEATIDMVDALEYLEKDEDTRVIGLYIEEIKRPKEFMKVVRRIVPIKPIVAIYVGGTDAGGRAIRSHTGSMAGNDRIFDAVAKQLGIIRAYTLEELLDYCFVLDKCPIPRGNRLCIFTNAGGPGATMADLAERLGLEVPPFSEKLQAKLREDIGPNAQVGNIVDLTFDLDVAKMYNSMPKAIMRSGEIDGMLVYGIFGTNFFKKLQEMGKDVKFPVDEMEQILFSLLKGYARFPKKYKIPIIGVNMLGPGDNATAYLQELGLPVFKFPHRAVKAFNALWHYSQVLEKYSRVDG